MFVSARRSVDNIYLSICVMSRVFANGPEDPGSIPGRVIPKIKNWYFEPPCFALSTIRQGSRVKRSNLGNGVALSLTPLCSSY